MYSRLTSRSCKTPTRSCVSRQGRLLSPQQIRGIRIKKFLVQDEPAKTIDLDRSYDSLVSETMTDLNQQRRGTRITKFFVQDEPAKIIDSDDSLVSETMTDLNQQRTGTRITKFFVKDEPAKNIDSDDSLMSETMPDLNQQRRGTRITKFFVQDEPGGIRIRKTYVQDEPAKTIDLDGSYDMLVSETVTDLNQQDAPPLARQAGDEIPAPCEPSKWDLIKQKFHYPPATATLAELDKSAIAKSVTIHGYLLNVRVVKQMVFANLVDFSGGHNLQVVSFLPRKDAKPAAEALHTQLASLKNWTPVALSGIIVRRDPAIGKRMGNLDIELVPERIHVLNSISDDLMITRDSNFGPEDRHLQIRFDHRLRRALWSRAKIASICRSELERHGFLEVETPILFKSTPEGAREFLVPTRQKGLMYALPQSPQQYKQILMASGVRRYFQFAKCFRDEDLRADRQPEFTQLDLEMSFAGANDVMTVMEALVKRIWEDRRGELSENLKFPLRRLSYDTAISTYGSDKPDLRFDHSKIRDVTVILPHLQNSDPNLIVEAFALKMKSSLNSPHQSINRLFDDVFSRTELQAKKGDQPVIAFIHNSNIARNAELLQRAKFDTREHASRFLSARDNEIVVIQARRRIANGGNTHLGVIRDALLKEGHAQQIVSRAIMDEIVWITDFPLFKLDSVLEPGQGGESGLSSTHHPFTAPRMEDIPLLEKNPLQAKAEHFDLVVNGVEIGGGSVRIHDAGLQKYILEDIIKVPQQRLLQFDHLLKVLASGCPPHAGMALGYDRLIALLNGMDSVRDVIAFPKNGKGADPLIGSPGLVGDKDLQGYYLKQV